MPFFTQSSTDSSSLARVCELSLPRKENEEILVQTPIFMPVGTRASVKGLRQEDLEEMGYRLILANTYHLTIRPGDDLIGRLGGVKKFMNWSGSLLTDSGGFQAFSLAEKVKFQESGIEFASHIDGARHMFTPGGVIDIQTRLGSDIMMVLDDCAPGGSDRKRLRLGLERTHRWAKESAEYFKRQVDAGLIDPNYQRLFGIIQGGTDAELRRESAEFIQSLPFAGIAVGGLSVGETRESFYETLAALGEHLDPARPRYLMGVGTIPDFLEAVRYGIDMFDCVLPTRNARNGQVFTEMGKLNLRNARYKELDEPVDPNCGCRVCQKYSLAYLRHLFTVGEMLGPQLATHHNLHFIFQFMSEMRKSIQENRFMEFYSRWKKIPF